MAKKTQETERERLDVDDGSLLPDREVMSILPIEPTGTYPDLGAAGPTPDTSTGGTGSAVDDSYRIAGTTADASGSGEESVTSDDRSETISQSDSASAGP